MKKRILRTETTTRQRATARELLKSLFTYGTTVTTLMRAKALKRNADTLVSKGRKDSPVTAIRAIMSSIGDRKVAHEVLKYVGYAVKKRSSGFASIQKIGFRRGDGTPTAAVSLMDFEKPLKKVKEDTKKITEKSIKKAQVKPTKSNVRKEAVKK